MHYLDCEFRHRLPLSSRILGSRKRLIEIFEHELIGQSPGAQDLLSNTLNKTETEPCCTHKNGPWVPFGGIRDPFLCEVAILSGRCPEGHRPHEVPPHWRERK
jgi:hypothetical protein